MADQVLDDTSVRGVQGVRTCECVVDADDERWKADEGARLANH